MLDGFGQKKRGQFVTGTFSLKLCGCFFFLPQVAVEIIDVLVQGLADQGAGGYGPVTPGKCSVLSTTFVKYACPD